MVRLSVVLAVFVSTVSAMGTAFGQREDDPNKAFNLGVDLAKKGRVADAVALWRANVDKVDPKFRPAVYKALGQGHRKLGELPDAWHFLTLYLKSTEKEDPQAAEWLEQVEKELSSTHVKIGISCEPGNATLWLDKTASGSSFPCPLSWWFKPGKNWLHAEKEGFDSKTDEIDVRERGGNAVHTIALAAIAQPPVVPHPASVASTLPPGDTTPPEATSPPGDTSPPGRAEPSSVSIEKPPSPGPETETWKWIILGSGGALVVTGAILHGVAYAKNEELHDKYPVDTSSPDYAEHRKHYNDEYGSDVQPLEAGAWSLYGLGGAAAAFAATAILFPELFGGAASTSSAPTPSLLPAGQGFVLDVRF